MRTNNDYQQKKSMYVTTAYSIFSKYFCINICDKVECFCALTKTCIKITYTYVVFV